MTADRIGDACQFCVVHPNGDLVWLPGFLRAWAIERDYQAAVIEDMHGYVQTHFLNNVRFDHVSPED